MEQNEILGKARLHNDRNQYGKSCSFYLLHFHNDNEKCVELKREFLIVFKNWLKKLIMLTNLHEFSSFLQTVLEICQLIKTDVVIVAAEILYQYDHTFEAAKLLSSCRSNDIVNYELEENLEQFLNILVDRWHFRMLNDKRRNLSYSLALKKAYNNGNRKVLDIGSGTGLLSMFAVDAGFDDVYSCEVSKVMCDVQADVLSCNKYIDKIKLLNKMSTSIEIGKDINERVDLVVTEIFDCGLLGERIIPTIIHAWENLLKPRKQSKVIPGSAVVYGICVECLELRKHFRYIEGSSAVIYGAKDPGDEREQFYTTEDMRNIKNGFKKLSEPFVLKTFDFNNPNELLRSLEHIDKVKVPITCDGKIDAIITSFRLSLDESINISTGVEDSSCCWEQAVYNMDFPCTTKKGDSVNFDVKCIEEQMVISLSNNNGFVLPEHKTLNKHNPKTFSTDRRMIARLNDENYVETFKQSILEQISMLESKKTSLQICFICPDVSIFPLLTAECGDSHIYIVEPSETLLSYLCHQKPSMAEQVIVLKRPLIDEMSTLQLHFDLVVTEPIDQNGLLKEHLIEDMTIIKSFTCDENTIFIPSIINVYSSCLHSQHLSIEHKVIDDDVTLGLKIANIINQYKVSTHPDLDMISIKHEMLSETVLCETIDFRSSICNSKEVEALNYNERKISSRKIAHSSGTNVTGFIYWFEMQLGGNNMIHTSPSQKTHWRQACYILPDDVMMVHDSRTSSCVEESDMIIGYVRNKSNIHFKLYR